jgi:hypothetical protein
VSNTAYCLHCGTVLEYQSEKWVHVESVASPDHTPCPYRVNPDNWK